MLLLCLSFMEHLRRVGHSCIHNVHKGMNRRHGLSKDFGVTNIPLCHYNASYRHYSKRAWPWSLPTPTLSRAEQGTRRVSPLSGELAPAWFLLPPPFHFSAITSDCVGWSLNYIRIPQCAFWCEGGRGLCSVLALSLHNVFFFFRLNWERGYVVWWQQLGGKCVTQQCSAWNGAGQLRGAAKIGLPRAMRELRALSKISRTSSPGWEAGEEESSGGGTWSGCVSGLEETEEVLGNWTMWYHPRIESSLVPSCFGSVNRASA